MTNPNLYTLDALIDWLRTKPAYEEYVYIDNGNCLIAQYLKERCGFKDPLVRPRSFSDGPSSDGPSSDGPSSDGPSSDGPSNDIPPNWNYIPMRPPQDFGAALERALKIQKRNS